MPIRVGLISDTHGVLRPEALAFLAGSDHIIHGGDIGNIGILEQLSAIAPLTVVRGNNDAAAWAKHIAAVETVRIGGINIYALHDITGLNVQPIGNDIRVVISGHSHKPSIAERDHVLYVNPGSAGPRRFNLPISLAELLIDGTAVQAHIHRITPPQR